MREVQTSKTEGRKSRRGYECMFVWRLCVRFTVVFLVEGEERVSVRGADGAGV